MHFRMNLLTKPDNDIGFVGPFDPTTFGFNGYVKGMKPGDMAGWESSIPKRTK